MAQSSVTSSRLSQLHPEASDLAAIDYVFTKKSPWLLNASCHLPRQDLHITHSPFKGLRNRVQC